MRQCFRCIEPHLYVQRAEDLVSDYFLWCNIGLDFVHRGGVVFGTSSEQQQ